LNSAYAPVGFISFYLSYHLTDITHEGMHRNIINKKRKRFGFSSIYAFQTTLKHH